MMIRTNDPRVRRIERERENQLKHGRDFRAAIRAGGDEKIKAFSERFPDGAWRGQRCFIIGGGPSLKGFDFTRLRGERVIAINKAYFDVPFADIMFAMDYPLISQITTGQLGENYRKSFEDFQGAKLWLDISGYSYPEGVYSVPSAGDVGWSKSLAAGLYHGNNSGYGALNLAMVLGANPIYLLGYDCAKGPAGEKNYHAGYPSGSNPDAVNIFRRKIEEGAKLEQAISHNIVNLNLQSALRCFPFGDVDKVLPAAAPPRTGVTAITPTGDRPIAFGLCQRWMAQQTRPVDQWIVVDDGKSPLLPSFAMQYVWRQPKATDPQHTLGFNLKAALPHIAGDKILIIEDDEYYAPRYVEEMAQRLDTAEVVGICRSKYYHLPTGGYQQIGNMGHASLAETGFRPSFLPVFTQCLDRGMTPRWPDDLLWQAVRDSMGKIKSHLFVDEPEPLYVGMKGLPGRGGIGMGHQTKMYRTNDTEDRAVLKRWIPKDYQAYLDILAGMK